MTTNPNDVRVSRELLPCPYCGRAARYVAEDYVDNSGEPWPFAECDACNTGAPVEFWNKRAHPADQQGEQMARMPVERCYDVRAKIIIAFNESKKAGGDLDDQLDAAYKSALRFSPNPDAKPATAKVVLPEREILRDVIAAVIGGDAYDCTRVWSAWGVGTMSDDDFVSIVEQEERLYELVDACLDEVAKLNSGQT